MTCHHLVDEWEDEGDADEGLGQPCDGCGEPATTYDTPDTMIPLCEACAAECEVEPTPTPTGAPDATVVLYLVDRFTEADDGQ